VSLKHQPGVPPHQEAPRLHAGLTYSPDRRWADAGRGQRRGRPLWSGGGIRSWSEGRRPGSSRWGSCANQRTRKIMLALADAPLAVSEMLTAAARSRELDASGAGCPTSYSRPARAPRARTRPALRADGASPGPPMVCDCLPGRWEWQWLRPEHAVPGSDLIDLLHMLAPIARVPEPTAGVCQLHVEAHGATDQDIYLVAHSGSIFALPEAPAIAARGGRPTRRSKPGATRSWNLMAGSTVSGNRTLMPRRDRRPACALPGQTSANLVSNASLGKKIYVLSPMS